MDRVEGPQDGAAVVRAEMVSRDEERDVDQSRCVAEEAQEQCGEDHDVVGSPFSAVLVEDGQGPD